MGINQINFIESEIGFLFQNDEIRIHFGKSTSNIEVLKLNYPETNFIRCKQIHSDIVADEKHQCLKDFSFTADAIVTTKKSGICISTADCTPVFIYDPISKKIAGIHSGWRGVVQNIVSKTILHFDKNHFSSLQIFIGPHILQDSFEIEEKFMNDIVSSISTKNFDYRRYYYVNDNNKYQINLSRVIQAQIQQMGLSSEQIHLLLFDTKTDFRFHSYRRDKINSGRQLSFIELL